MNIDDRNDLSAMLEEGAKSLAPGVLVAAKYEVSSCLGGGGMGTVYLVKQIFLGKDFALKLMEKQHHSDVAVRRFQQEARTTAGLRHPNLVEVHDFGVHENDQPFLVMDYVQGYTLAKILKGSGSLSVDYVTALALELSQGLNYAHSQGVVHRDIKPSNIMILHAGEKPSRGTIKILDFGIAKLSQAEAGEIQELTKTGEIFGSPIYMSPEQCQGTAVDRRADIYSLGCVLFECLTGTPPFLGDSAMSTMLKRITDHPPTLREASLGLEFPAAIEAIVRKMLELDPKNRYQDLDAVIKELTQLQRDLDSDKNSILIQTEIPKPKRKSAILKNLAIVITTAILSTGAMATVDRKVVFRAEFAADKTYREELKRQAELADKKSAQTVFMDYKEVLRYPTREFVGQGDAKQEVLRFPNRCGKIGFGTRPTKEPAFGEFRPDGRLVNLYLDEEAAADPNILKNLLDVNFGTICFTGNYRISNETLGMVGKLKHLKELDVDGGDISSLEPIYDMKLDKLDVGEARLSASEILKLKYLKDLESITFGPVDNPAAVISELAKGKHCNSFFYKGALPADNEAKLWRELNENDVDLIVQMPGLQNVAFKNCAQFDDACLDKLTAMKSLTGVEVKDCSLTPKSLKILKKMNGLRELRLTATGWPASALAEFNSLSIKDKKIEAPQAVKNNRSYKINLDVAKSFDLKDPALDP